LEWWATWRTSGARVVESSTRKQGSSPLRFFVRYGVDVVWF
jgi:hypothetical protein